VRLRDHMAPLVLGCVDLAGLLEDLPRELLVVEV
jgi:hypothetical protein